jgi:hypothetical protein
MNVYLPSHTTCLWRYRTASACCSTHGIVTRTCSDGFVTYVQLPMGCRLPYPYVRGDYDHDHTCSLLVQYMHRRDRSSCQCSRARGAGGGLMRRERRGEPINESAATSYSSLNSTKLNSRWQNNKSTREFKQCVCVYDIYVRGTRPILRSNK